MSRPKFYLDADSSSGVILRAARARNLDIESAVEAGLRTAADPAQIAHVQSTGRILITGDHRLREQMAEVTRAGGHHPGVLFLPAVFRNSIGDIIGSLELLDAAATAEEMTDMILFIPF